MIDELSSHILDIVTNSVTAKAHNIRVCLEEDDTNSVFTMELTDDGLGMDAEMVQKVQDPFFSTKEGRKVGLGIPLLKATAETTGGSFLLESRRGKGTKIVASFDMRHPDLPILGNFKDTVFVLTVGNPDVNFLFKYKGNGHDFRLDTAEIKRELRGIPMNHPGVVSFLSKYLDENL